MEIYQASDELLPYQTFCMFNSLEQSCELGPKCTLAAPSLEVHIALKWSQDDHTDAKFPQQKYQLK